MKQTPWGKADGEVELAEGIKSYHTPSHGGIWLSKKRQAQLGYSKNFLNNPEWWEEDCDWAVPYAFFAQEIGERMGDNYFIGNLNAALETIKEYHPDFQKILDRRI